MTLEQLRNHVLYLKERDNSDVSEESFEKDMEIILKYIAQVEKSHAEMAPKWSGL